VRKQEEQATTLLQTRQKDATSLALEKEHFITEQAKGVTRKVKI
jgi:hypothetical protein